MATSFLRRTLDVTIILRVGTFADGGDKVTISGHKVNCFIQQPAGESQGVCNCVIWGLPFDLMNRLVSIGINNLENRRNIIQIDAGFIDVDDKKTTAIAYKGTIVQAWADFNNQPDAYLNFVASGAVSMQLTPVTATSMQGSVPIEGVFAEVLRDSGYKLENKGVGGSLSDPHLRGTTLEKIQELARSTGSTYSIDDTSSTVTISPLNKGIDDDIVTVNVKNGMVGYPTFCESGIIVQTLYNPAIQFNHIINLESSLPAANGEFRAFDIYHNLEAEDVDGQGQWFTTFRAFRPPAAV